MSPSVDTKTKSVWVCWKLVSLHLARSSRQVLLRAFLLLHFLPLFAQRFGAIIGTTAQHYSYVNTHSSTKGASVCQRPTPSWKDLPSRSRTANAQLLPQPGAWRCATLRVWLIYFFLSGDWRPLTAGTDMSYSAARGDISVSAAAS